MEKIIQINSETRTFEFAADNNSVNAKVQSYLNGLSQKYTREYRMFRLLTFGKKPAPPLSLWVNAKISDLVKKQVISDGLANQKQAESMTLTAAAELVVNAKMRNEKSAKTPQDYIRDYSEIANYFMLHPEHLVYAKAAKVDWQGSYVKPISKPAEIEKILQNAGIKDIPTKNILTKIMLAVKLLSVKTRRKTFTVKFLKWLLVPDFYKINSAPENCLNPYKHFYETIL